MTPPSPDSLAQRLRAVRAERRLSQDQLAEASGVDQATISLLESGRRTSPSAAALHAIARALDVDPRDLMPPSVSEAEKISGKKRGK